MSISPSSSPAIHSRSQRPDTWLIIPCYNETQRLCEAEFLSFAAKNSWAGLLFVNDGSTDETLAMLDRLVDKLGSQGARVDLPQNRGKAEAVRAGMLVAMRFEPSFAGYWDADLATPLNCVEHFRQTLQTHDRLSLVAGTRMPLMGRSIERHPMRAWIGRCFARVASLAMSFRMWDTQCGAKMFRVTPLTWAAFSETFRSSWIFDVEILSRINTLLGPSDATLRQVVYELPLDHWREIPGSKVKGRDFLKAAYELMLLYWNYRCKTWRSPDDESVGLRPSFDVAGGLVDPLEPDVGFEHRSKAA